MSNRGRPSLSAARRRLRGYYAQLGIPTAQYNEADKVQLEALGLLNCPVCGDELEVSNGELCDECLQRENEEALTDVLEEQPCQSS